MHFSRRTFEELCSTVRTIIACQERPVWVVKLKGTHAMTKFRPKYVTFDCYGTLTNFDMAGAARRVYAERLSVEAMANFVEAFRGYRLDEVLGAWKPFAEVVHNAVERSCKR